MDIVNDIAGKRGFSVDEEGFNALMREQKQRARAAWKGSGEKDIASRFQSLLEDGLKSDFFGYDAAHRRRPRRRPARRGRPPC